MIHTNSTHLKISVLTLLTVMLTTRSFSQTTITYPTGNPQGLDERRPYGVYFGYNRTAAIYLTDATELNIPSGSILTSVGFYLGSTNNPPSADYNIKIYVREVPSATMNPASFNSLASFGDLKYDGLMTTADWAGAAHWVTRPLTDYNNQLVTTGAPLEFLIETNWASSTGDQNGWWPVSGNPYNIIFSQNLKT